MSIKTKIRALKNLSGEIDVEEIYNQLSSYKYVSFDLFDTLIKRNVNTPTDIFRIMELSLDDNFTFKRIEAESKARKKVVDEEITLADIYDAFPDNNKENLILRELETELAAITPNLPMLEVYHRCVADRKKIFITTDMYWSIESIRQLLQQNDIVTYDRIYLSSKEKKTKRTGNLFKLLLEEQNIQPNELIHIGDHLQSDCIVPKKLGIATIQIPKKVRNIQFKQKSDKKLQNNYLNCLIRNTYLGGNDEYYEFGYSQFGKLLWGYSRWIHQKAVDKNIKELFFFARDGWIMKQAYDICINDPSIKTHYLEVSRRSLRAPILWMDFDYNKVLDMLINAKLISIKSIFDGLGLDIDNYIDHLTKYDITKDTVYDKSTIRENEKLKILIHSLKDDIVKNSKEEYEALSSYLEINNVSGKIGIVDIGYAGSMQRYLQQTLNAMKIPHEISGFYLAVADYYKKNDSSVNSLDLNGYLFDFKHDPNAEDTRSSYVGLFETLFLEQGGSVKRYHKATNEIEIERYPYEYYKNGKPTKDFIKIKSLQQGALDFISMATKDKFLNRFEFSVNDLFYGIYKTGTDPNKHDLNLFSEIEFYDEGITTKLADPKKLGYYICHMEALKHDFLSCRWKIGFMKKLLKMRLPYQKIYFKMKKVEK